MGTSVFTLLMSLIWCSVFILLSVLWRKTMSLKHGVSFALAAISIGIFRMIFPVEFPLTVVIQSDSIMPFFQHFFGKEVILGTNFSISRFDMLKDVWITGSVVYLACIVGAIVRQWRWTSKIRIVSDDTQVQKIMNAIVLSSRPKQRYQIIVCDEVSAPMMMGYFTPTILLPVLTLSDDKLRYVLLHEWNHFIHKHLWIKLLFNVFCALLWWNPLVYFAKADLDYILEVNCDQDVVCGLNDAERAKYVESTSDVMKQLVLRNGRQSMAAVGFVAAKQEKIVKRCKLILFPPKAISPLTKGVIILMLSGILALSYTFVFQPITQPPQDDSDTPVVSINSGNSYLKPNPDGTYTLFYGKQGVDTIDESKLNTFPYSSLPIIEEGK